MLDLKELKNPSSNYRSKPFWSLNGKLEKPELRRQILEMKEMGFGGVFLHSRTQLETEYMSEEWLDLMEYCIDCSKEVGLEAYLYDEDRWPSGTCGGMVTRTKEFKEKSIDYKEIIDFKSYTKSENFIGLFAVEIDIETNLLKSFRKIDSFDNILCSERVFEFFFEYAVNDPFYNGEAYVDTLNLDATKKFIELTHEKYRKKFGDRFGKDIFGIFQDEANRGPFFSGFTRIEKNNKNFIPYTYKLFDEFYKRKGYRIEDYLPKVYFGDVENPFVKETYDLIEVLEELFLENFAKPYYDWCEKYNLKSTGHILHEDNLAAQTLMSGSCMRYYEFMHYPGIDNLGKDNYKYFAPAFCSSVSKQLGKEYTLDELYGITGWDTNLSDYKRIGDWQSFLGITLRCPHLSWYTMKGEAKRDCPASILHQSAWYKKYKLVEDYFGRLTYLLKESTDTTDIAIINPIESTWGLSNSNIYIGPFETNNKLYQKIEYEYEELYKSLTLNGIMSDYIDEGILLNHGRVEDDKFICGLKEYKTIILNSNYELRLNTLNRIKEFIKNGGRVILVGSYPEYLDGIRHDFNEDLEGVIKIDFDMEKLVSLLKDDSISIIGNLMVEKKLLDNKLILFMLNRSSLNENIRIKIKSNNNFVKLNLRVGEVEKLEYSNSNGYIIIDKEFSPDEELVILEGDYETLNPAKIDFKEVEFPKEFSYKLKDDNMLMLSYADCIYDNKHISNDCVLSIDRKLREEFNLEFKFSQMIQPWYKKKFLNYNSSKLTDCTLIFKFKSLIDNIPLKLMYEKDDTLKAKLNGHIINMDNPLSSDIDICYNIVNINKECIIKGENILELNFDYYDKTNIESIFLLGDFGVYNDGTLDYIDKLPNKLSLSELSSQGLLYYGSEINLQSNLDKGIYKFDTEKIDLAYMSINKKDVLFQPFNTCFESDGKLDIDIILNRYNSFRFNLGYDYPTKNKPCGLLTKIKFYKGI